MTYSFENCLQILTRAAKLKSTTARQRIFNKYMPFVVTCLSNPDFTSPLPKHELILKLMGAQSLDLISLLPPISPDISSQCIHWPSFIENLSPDIIHAGLHHGLLADWNFLLILLNSGDYQKIQIAVDLLSPQHMWFFNRTQFAVRWQSIKDSTVAALFLTSQINHFPIQYNKCWLDAMMCSDHVRALAIQSVLRISDHLLHHFDDPLSRIIQAADSNHQKLKLLLDYSNPIKIHNDLVPPDQPLRLLNAQAHHQLDLKSIDLAKLTPLHHS